MCLLFFLRNRRFSWQTLPFRSHNHGMPLSIQSKDLTLRKAWKMFPSSDAGIHLLWIQLTCDFYFLKTLPWQIHNCPHDEWNIFIRNLNLVFKSTTSLHQSVLLVKKDLEVIISHFNRRNNNKQFFRSLKKLNNFISLRVKPQTFKRKLASSNYSDFRWNEIISWRYMLSLTIY